MVKLLPRNHSSVKKYPTKIHHQHSPQCIGCKVSVDSESEAMCYDLALLEKNYRHWLDSAKNALKVIFENINTLRRSLKHARCNVGTNQNKLKPYLRRRGNGGTFERVTCTLRLGVFRTVLNLLVG